MKSWGTSNSEMDHSRFVAANPGRCPGYIQPSLRDWVVSLRFYPGLTSWATLSRSTGLDLARAVLIWAREGWDQSEDDLSAVGAALTNLRDWVVSRAFTQDSRPGFLSAVPTGFDLARAVLIWARKGWDQSEADLSAVGAALTNLRDWVVSRAFTQDSRPGLLSAVPTGLDLARAVLIWARKGWDQSEADLSAVGAALTNLRDWVVSRAFTQDSRPGLLSAVPTGLD